MTRPSAEERARRQAARARVGEYHQQELAKLIGEVRAALDRLDRGEIDVFEFDDVMPTYKKAAQKLWSFCNVTGAHLEGMARRLDEPLPDEEPIDWWQLASRHRRQAD